MTRWRAEYRAKCTRATPGVRSQSWDAPAWHVPGTAARPRDLSPRAAAPSMASRPSACENVDIAAAGSVLLDDASVQNCGPKTGRSPSPACTVERATLRDDGPETQPN